MKITNLKVNHLTNPIGWDMEKVVVSYKVEESRGKEQEWARICVAADADMNEIIYDSGSLKDLDSAHFEVKMEYSASTAYYWRVEVMTDEHEYGVSETACFETPKGNGWSAEWITPDVEDKSRQMTVHRSVHINKPVKKARIYCVGLGLYELFLNGTKQGDECLLPGFCDYDSWIPFQTYPLELLPGENHVKFRLGDGWYKGWFGLRQTSENYGDRLALIAEIHIWYEDGTFECIGTDESWKAGNSQVVYSGIYPGEIFDATIDESPCQKCRVIDLDKNRLSPRLSPPIRVHEKIVPAAKIDTPNKEYVLDMGQNMVGWLSFRCSAPKGKKLHFKFGEILQDGCFYNDNLRTAKAEFTYISDGQEREVRQHFTFYGFRFVKVEGLEQEEWIRDVKGMVIHSDMDRIGMIQTSNPLVNRLFENAWWGQKGNFVDVPTDCPQRDERYGWTGDAQIFSGTACYNADTYAFYTKYGKDVYSEQKKLNGSVPDVVPVCNYPGDASTAWGEAATVIPWNVYLHSGDQEILRRQYASMKAWVDYMKREDDRSGGERLWRTGFHYGDWLALDGKIQGGVYGATDPHLIATAYYYLSSSITAKTAAVLGCADDEKFYRALSEDIKAAFIREYFSSAGRLCVDTMTAYVVVLYMGLYPDSSYARVCEGLRRKLSRNRYHLETGFVGTPYLCRVLSDHGMNELAYHLLLEEGFPGWLYEVKMGATTVWERWNSVMPDGRISGTEMNSLNHYAYGSIVEWMYRNMIGIKPDENKPGFRYFVIEPKPDWQMESAGGSLNSPYGTITSKWRIVQEEGGEKLHMEFAVPFGTEADIILPDASSAEEELKRQIDREGILCGESCGDDYKIRVRCGTYCFSYKPGRPYRKIYSIDSPFEELMADSRTRDVLEKEFFSIHSKIPFEKELYTLREIMEGPFTTVDWDKQKEIDKKLRSI